MSVIEFLVVALSWAFLAVVAAFFACLLAWCAWDLLRASVIRAERQRRIEAISWHAGALARRLRDRIRD